MEPTERKIEIFAPFGEAFELTSKVLFKPFNFGKYLTIAFAAFLATFFSGLNFNTFHQNSRYRNWNWKTQTSLEGMSVHEMSPLIIGVIIFAVLFGLALIVLFVWLKSRGRFIFTDCIVRNRGAIVVPWKEYRQEGNSYFLFQMAITFVSLICFGTLGVLMILGHPEKNPIFPLALLIFLGVTFALLALVIGAIVNFMVPVMYRQRCRPTAAFAAVWNLIMTHPGVFILFLLFYFLLLIASLMIGVVATCVTCCMAAIPYIGTVILLPIIFFLFAYPLCFLRQFGDAYDVFAVAPSVEPASFSSGEPPPIQHQPPSIAPPPPTATPPPPPEEPPSFPAP